MEIDYRLVSAIRSARRVTGQWTTLEGKLRAAMRDTISNPQCPDVILQFRAALSAVLLDYDEDSIEFSWLLSESIRQFGKPGSADGATPGCKASHSTAGACRTVYPPIDLVAMWRAINREHSK